MHSDEIAGQQQAVVLGGVLVGVDATTSVENCLTQLAVRSRRGNGDQPTGTWATA